MGWVGTLHTGPQAALVRTMVSDVHTQLRDITRPPHSLPHSPPTMKALKTRLDRQCWRTGVIGKVLQTNGSSQVRVQPLRTP